MNPITHTLLPVMLTAHKLWLDGDLRGCRLGLTGADLTGAVLSRAVLTGADLTNTGIVCLAVGDPRGYRPVLFEGMVYSGCRAFTVGDALAHWGSPEYHTPELGTAYCRAIKEATSHE